MHNWGTAVNTANAWTKARPAGATKVTRVSLSCSVDHYCCCGGHRDWISFFSFLLFFSFFHLVPFFLRFNHGCRRRLRGEGGGRPFGQIQGTVGWFERRQLDAREDEKVKRRHWQGHEENGNEWNENGWAIWRLSKLTDHCLDLLMMKASRTFRVVTTRCDNIKNMYDNTKIFKYMLHILL